MRRNRRDCRGCLQYHSSSPNYYNMSVSNCTSDALSKRSNCPTVWLSSKSVVRVACSHRARAFDEQKRLLQNSFLYKNIRRKTNHSAKTRPSAPVPVSVDLVKQPFLDQQDLFQSYVRRKKLIESRSTLSCQLTTSYLWPSLRIHRATCGQRFQWVIINLVQYTSWLKCSFLL